MNLPALTTTPADMAAALDRVAGAGTSDLIRWTNDPAIDAIVSSWPAHFRTARAHRLGLDPDHSFDDIIGEYVAVPAPQPGDTSVAAVCSRERDRAIDSPRPAVVNASSTMDRKASKIYRAE